VNPHQVKSWEAVEGWLKSKGFTQTSEKVEGGRIWRSKSKRHIIVTNHVDGFYPEFLWADLVKRVEKIVP
jgi:hypothetical protein